MADTLVYFCWEPVGFTAQMEFYMLVDDRDVIVAVYEDNNGKCPDLMLHDDLPTRIVARLAATAADQSPKFWADVAETREEDAANARDQLGSDRADYEWKDCHNA